MHYSLEMIFDNKTEEKINSILLDLAEINAGLLSFDKNALPHMTIGNWNDIEINECCEKIKLFLKDIQPFEVSFNSIGIFPTSGCVYLSPVVTGNLLNFHRKIHMLLSDCNHIGWEYYLPDMWVPHCGLDISTNINQICKTANFVINTFEPLSGTINNINLYECCEPVKRLIKKFPLNNFQS